jgi:hypothetical protein
MQGRPPKAQPSFTELTPPQQPLGLSFAVVMTPVRVAKMVLC